MSPEQMIGGSEPDARTDIYSLGCVLYEMLTGHAPFDGPGGFVARLTDPPPSARASRPEVPVALDRVVSKALGRIPEERFSTAADMIAALERIVLSPLGESPTEHESITDWFTRFFKRTSHASMGVAAGTIILAAGVAASVMWKKPAANNDSPRESLRHIAVLYFDDLTSDKRLAHVAAGLTENLIDQLSQVSALRVISPNGVRPFRDSVFPVDTIARRLNAGTLVGGSVSTSGATMRLTVRLIDGKTGEEFHSRTFERPAWDLFKLQDSLTADVAFSLRERVGAEIRLREQKSVANSVSVWELVQRTEAMTVRAAELLRSGDSTGEQLLHRADSAFAQAEKADPKWVTPTVDRARNALTIALVQPGDNDSTRIFLDQAVRNADRALLKDPDAPEALAVRGEARVRLVTFGAATGRIDSVLSLAEADLRKAASERPDQAHTWTVLGDLYFEKGLYAQAADAYKTGYDTDAFLTENRSITQMLMFSNLSSGKFDDARQWCRIARSRFREDPRFRECELVVLGWSGRSKADVANAWKEIGAIERADSAGVLSFNKVFRRMMVAAVVARSGMRDSARAVVTRALREGGPEQPAMAAEAYVYVLIGDRAEAIKVLRRLVAAAPQVRAKVAHSPWFAELKDEPAFQQLLKTA